MTVEEIESPCAPNPGLPEPNSELLGSLVKLQLLQPSESFLALQNLKWASLSSQTIQTSSIFL